MFYNWKTYISSTSAFWSRSWSSERLEGLLASLFGALQRLLGVRLGLEIGPEALITIGSATSWAVCGLFLSLLAASSCFSFFEIVVYLVLEPLRVDCDLPRRPSEPKKQSFTIGQLTCSQNRRLGAEDGPESVLGPSWPPCWCS